MTDAPINAAIAERFAANLRTLRADAALSQEELAFRAELDRSEIDLMEAGRRLPRYDTLTRLVGALGVPASELFAGIRWTPEEHGSGGFLIGGGDDG